MPLISNSSLTPTLSRIAVAAAASLVSFVIFTSQYWLLWSSWSLRERLWFNFLVGCVAVTYYRSATTDPGGLVKDWVPANMDEVKQRIGKGGDQDVKEGVGKKLWGSDIGRWCRKCEAWKPPRAHHCKTCRRCVLRMDHHCPWTNNCVGYRNLPHFMRFLGFTSFAGAYLEFHLLRVASEVWEIRDLPSYEGTYSAGSLVLLVLLLLINTLACFVLSILFVRNVWCIAEGTTTIEYWEKDRHDSLVRRRMVGRVVFPWDIGIWENLCEAMGGHGWWFLWWWPFASSRIVYGDGGKAEGRGWDWERDGGGGFRWEINGFEDATTPWPPTDPEKSAYASLPRGLPPTSSLSSSYSHSTSIASLTNEEYINEFRRRQAEDLKRFKKVPGKEGINVITNTRTIGKSGWDGVWRNADGETLGDYGVDEETEWGGELKDPIIDEHVGELSNQYPVSRLGTTSQGLATSVNRGEGANIESYDNCNGDGDDDVPLAELLRRRKGRGQGDV